MFKRCLAFLTALLCCMPSYGMRVCAELSYDDYYKVLDAYNIDDNIPRYKDYLPAHNGHRPSDVITINAGEYTNYTVNGLKTAPLIYDGYAGMGGVCVLSDEDSVIEFTFNVEEAGLYNLSMLYYPVPGKSGAISRGVFINGELPFKEFALVEFHRTWHILSQGGYYDENNVWRLNWESDNQGNDLKPRIVEVPDWSLSYFYDYNGYVLEELCAYFEQGENTIALVAMREPVIIRQITLSNTISHVGYTEKKAQWDAMGALPTSGQLIRIEAENAVLTSSQMLYPVQDKSSPAVYPSSAKTLLNNSIGGNSWNASGQWIEWEFIVPETGYYNIALQLKQNFQKGVPVTRKITIDGEAPFSELSGMQFLYAQNWREQYLSDSEGEPYLIYLTEGTHTLRMEAALGEFAEIIGLMQETLYDLNAIYRSVIRILGVAPDQYRDYQIERNIPSLGDELAAARDKLNTVITMLNAAAPEASDKAAVLLTMRDQLDDLIKDRERFAKTVGAYRINTRACGMWITQVLAQPLQLDSIFILSPDMQTGVKKPGFWASLWFELKKLFYSFIIDYNKIGNVADEADSKTLTLWIGTGRDQANIIKSLIDKTFTGEHNINVNVMIVDMSTLLQAALAGQGPDIAIQVANDVPVNYGLRNAVADLSQFEDLPEVLERFYPAAVEAMGYEGAVYGLPETQMFPMMFYRKDVLSELGITELPDTWDDVKVLMAVLAKNQMEFGMFPVELNFATILFQNGGTYYTDDAKRSALDSEEAVKAFRIFCNYYTDYKLDRITSVEERFRTGEAPIIITEYGFYNNLQVSAPDLKGVWGFASVPGTVREDGSIDRTVASGGFSSTACIMLNAAKDKQSAWEFMKWWTSAETQISYSREMESLLGASARVPTANIEAFASLPWSKAELDALSKQFEQTRGIRQVPGGYYTFRNVNNAFYRITNSETGAISPREELMDKIILINDEIRYKRTEFGMETD